MSEKETPGVIAQLKEAIRRWKEVGGKSMNQLGKESGVDTARITRFINDERTLTLPAVEKICRVLNLSLTECVPGEAQSAEPEE